MPLVFVHGVAVRTDSDYLRETRRRDALFRAALEPILGSDPLILNPAWGELVPDIPRIDNRIIPMPGSEIEPLAAEGDATLDDADDLAGIGDDLVHLARRSLPDAVDALFAARLAGAGKSTVGPISKQAVAAAAYARENPLPAWVHRINTVDELETELARALRQTEAGGVRPASLIETAGFFDWPADRLLEMVRPAFTHGAALFMGDVIAYLSTRGTADAPGPIPSLILDAIQTAAAGASGDGAPLILVGHSMGGNILMDLLATFAPEIRVHALVTVGSQVSLFRQLGAFGPRLSGPGRAPRPAAVGRWINIIDHHDTLAFLCEPEFEGVEDRAYRTEAGLIGAHSGYFERASFYDRLAGYLG